MRHDRIVRHIVKNVKDDLIQMLMVFIFKSIVYLLKENISKIMFFQASKNTCFGFQSVIQCFWSPLLNFNYSYPMIKFHLG
jgi:hypothetical protein